MGARRKWHAPPSCWVWRGVLLLIVEVTNRTRLIHTPGQTVSPKGSTVFLHQCWVSCWICTGLLSSRTPFESSVPYAAPRLIYCQGRHRGICMNGRTKAVDPSRTRSKLGLLVRALGWPEQTSLASSSHSFASPGHLASCTRWWRHESVPVKR